MLHPFVKGQTGNPFGRPKGFGRLIREATADGKEMVELALRIMRGRCSLAAYVGKDALEVRVKPSFKERLDALKWLADRGWGKVPDVPMDADPDKDARPLGEVAAEHLENLGEH